jgi:hypothetical protein
VDCNEAKMKEGLLQLNTAYKRCFFEKWKCYKYFKIEDCHKGQIAQVIDVLSSVKCALDILTVCTGNVRKGIL